MAIFRVIRVTRPTPIRTSMGISYSGIERVWGIYKNSNQVHGRDGFCSIRPAPYVNYQFIIMSLQNTQKVIHI